MQRDAAIAIIGAVLLLVGIYGAFQYEADGGGGTGGGTYPVGWSLNSARFHDGSEDLTVGQTRQVDVPILVENLTEVRVAATWNDSVGDGDTVRVTVTSPDGRTQATETTNEAGSPGEVLVTVLVNRAPQGATVSGASRQQAQRQLDAQATSQGAGTYVVTIELVEAPGQRLPLPGNPEVQPDGQEQVAVQVTASSYRGELSG